MPFRPGRHRVIIFAVHANSHDRYIGLQLDVPLFEGFSRTDKVKQAEAQVEEKRGSLDEAEQQVELGVWTGTRNLRTATENLHISQQELDTARASLQSVQRRYRLGVAGIVEMLNMQTSLAHAEQQHIQSVADWYTARLMLAQAIGNLGMWGWR